MALMITDECIGCGVCLSECPHQAICEEDGNFWIRAGRCTECAEDPEGPHCRRLCPMPEVIVTNPRRTACCLHGIKPQKRGADPRGRGKTRRSRDG